MNMTFKSVADKVTDSLLNDEFRQPFMVMVLSFLMSIICLVSAIPHFVDDPEGTYVMAILLSGVFVASVAVFLLTLFVRKYHNLWRHIFMGVVIVLFAYCCWDGGPNGFIHLWLILVPAFSFITFGIFEGFITSVPILIIMFLFFWTPLSNYIKFNESGMGFVSLDFKLRMTLVYLVSLLLGFLTELLRHVASNRLKLFNNHYEYVSMHDPLTGLANQNFLSKYLEDIHTNKEKYKNLGCLFVDVDAFKKVNDNYGHLFGNDVLIRIAQILSEEKKAFVCRWGGDEYVICFTNIDEDYLRRVGEKYRATISACTFEEQPKFHITVSVGAVILPVDDTFNFNHVLELADSANRTAKTRGKDNVSFADANAPSKFSK